MEMWILVSKAVAQKTKWNEVADGDNTSWTVTADGVLKTIVKPEGGSQPVCQDFD